MLRGLTPTLSRFRPTYRSHRITPNYCPSDRCRPDAIGTDEGVRKFRGLVFTLWIHFPVPLVEGFLNGTLRKSYGSSSGLDLPESDTTPYFDLAGPGLRSRVGPSGGRHAPCQIRNEGPPPRRGGSSAVARTLSVGGPRRERAGNFRLRSLKPLYAKCSRGTRDWVRWVPFAPFHGLACPRPTVAGGLTSATGMLLATPTEDVVPVDTVIG